MIANRIRNSIILSTTLTASLLAAGCDAVDAPEDFAGDQAHALRPSGGGGIVFNTLTFGHLSASEVVLGQPSPDGVVLESVEVLFDGQYAAVENLWAEQGEIHATIPGYEALHAYESAVRLDSTDAASPDAATVAPARHAPTRASNSGVSLSTERRCMGEPPTT